MNGVAREFWSEVFDLKAPAEDGGGRRETSRRKKARKTLVRRAASNRVG